MRPKITIVSVLGLCAIFLLSATPAPAAPAGQHTRSVVTFQKPAEIPGLILEPGTYAFERLAVLGDRDVVQVYDEGHTRHYATFLAISRRLEEPIQQTIVRFAQDPADSPGAIKAWVHPDEMTADEFVYPRDRALELARKSGHAVAAMSSDLAGLILTPAQRVSDPSVQQMKATPLVRVTPEGNEEAVTPGESW